MEIVNHFNHIHIVIVFSISCLCMSNNSEASKSERKERCITAKSELGECIDLKECPKLFNILKEAKTNKETKDYLTGSVCTYVGGNPVICCPLDNPVNLDNIVYNALPSPPKCGTSKHIEGSRIVGGRPSILGEWPWEVSLAYQSKLRRKKGISYHCGGTLISDQYVMTAAHCGSHQNLILKHVRMGVVSLNSNKNSDPPAVDINVEKFIAHQDYDPKVKYNNDIALIKLAERVDFSKYIQPICLPKTNDLIFKNFVTETVYVAGWGTLGYYKKTSHEQMEIEVKVLNRSVCDEAYSKFGVRLTNRHLCAGDLKGERDSCQGDSGGPLMLKKYGVTYALGIVSFGYRCAQAGFPGIYTRVSAYLHWISQILEK